MHSVKDEEITDLKFHVKVSPEEERYRVSLDAATIDGTVYGRFENIV